MADADNTHDNDLRDEPLPEAGDPEIAANSENSADAAIESGDSGAAVSLANPSNDELRDELSQAEDRVLRVQAELENYRKRSRRELEDSQRYANLPLMADILSVLDNLDRAVEAAQQHENAAGLIEGVKMVSTQLISVLERYHCQVIAADGVAFDPDLHEAVGQEPSDTLPQGTIVRVLRNGHQLHDRLVRPSQVMISSGPPE